MEQNNTEEPNLLILSYSGDVESLQNALQSGVPTDQRNKYGSTALHFAASRGHSDCVRALVAAGADVNALGDDGSTPLHWACNAREMESAIALIETGADLNLRDHNGWAAVHWAIVSRHSECAIMLINAGAILDQLEIENASMYNYTDQPGWNDIVSAFERAKQ